MWVEHSTDEDDAPEHEAEPVDLIGDLRARFSCDAGRGAWLEIVLLSRTQIVEHAVVPPLGRAAVAGLSFVVGARGAACFDGGTIRSGESLRIDTPHGELLLRFVPAPARLLPVDASRFALVFLLAFACASALASAHTRPVEPATTSIATHAEQAQSSARRRRSAARVRDALRRAHARRARVRRPRFRRPGFRRNARPARRVGPRRKAPSSDGGDGDGDGDIDPQSRWQSARAPTPRARGPPAHTTQLTFAFVLATQEELMLVVQIFVMRNGALQGVEMACGERLVVGPPDADVPLADIGDCGVELRAVGETLLAVPWGDDVRVDGDRLRHAVALTPQSDVVIGSYTLKFRRQSLPRSKTPAPVQLQPALPEATPTVSELPAPTRAFETALETLAPTLPDSSVGPAADTPPAEPRAWWVDFDADLRDELDDVPDDVDWSLVQALARPRSNEGGRFVEVVCVQGERVLDHALLDAGTSFVHGGTALVRRRADGACALHVPAGGAVRTLRGGSAQDLFARDGAIDVVLKSGDAANVRLGDRQLLVRFTSAPAVAASREDRLLHRAEQRMQAACAGVGMSLCTLWGGALWLLDYRDRELVLSLDDEDVSQWQPVELVMTPPPPEPEPAREPQPAPEPQPSESAPAAPAMAARGSKHHENTTTTTQQPLDVLKSLPALQTNRALDQALANVRAPLPARPGGPILQPMIGRGRGGDLEIGGSGLSTGGASRGLKDGAGGMSERAARDIGGTVARAKLRNLTTPPAQGLSKDEILRVINAHIGEIAVCYERGLRNDTKLGGRVEVEWIIDERGHVAKARLEHATLQSDAVIGCMLDRIKAWRFPKAKSSSLVSYPFSFASL